MTSDTPDEPVVQVVTVTIISAGGHTLLRALANTGNGGWEWACFDEIPAGSRIRVEFGQ